MTEIQDEIMELPIGRLKASGTNPRRVFNDSSQWELMESIRSVGVLSYLLVRPVGSDFEIVAGERRWRAARALGLKSIPCRVRELTDEAVGKIQLIENIQRAELSPVEELRGVKELEEYGIRGAELAKALGKTGAWVQARLDLGTLPESAQEAIGAGRVSLASVPDLLEVDEEECGEFVQELLEIEEPVPVATLRAMVEERYRVPREGRERWRHFAEGYETNVALEDLDILEDPEQWAEYVRPYGEAVGKWRLAGDEIGGLAARAEESRLTWGDLAKAHGVKRKLVPVGGVRSGEISAVELVDRSMIEAAEKAAKAAGEAFTIGSRKAAKKEELSVVSGQCSDSGGAEDGGEDLGAPVPVMEGDQVTRGTGWNPWTLELDLYDEEYNNRIALVREILDSETEAWRENAQAACAESIEGVQESVLVVWWVLHGLDPSELRGRRIAVLLGVREIWLQRIGA